MKIKKIEYDFSVCKVADYSEVNAKAEYCFTGKTDEENSLVCFTSDVPANALERDDGWKACCIQGILDFSMVGILSEIVEILTENKISMRVISTFHTDYILIKKENYEKALELLDAEGYKIV